MKRLTIRNSDGSVSQPMDLRWDEALKRLAAYEDTGLTPEEIRYCLNGSITAEEAKAHYDEARKQYDEWFAWKQAEADGRLVVQPCAPGTEVWVVERVGRYVVGAYRYMFLAKVGDAVILTPYRNGLKNVQDASAYYIQKTAEDAEDYADLAVFPVDDCYTTREKAEKALEKEKNDE